MIGAISRVSGLQALVQGGERGRRTPGVPGPSQNRRRDRRTYQLDRSSMKPAIRRPGGGGVESLHRRGDVADQRVQLAQHPPVQHRALRRRRRAAPSWSGPPGVCRGGGRVGVQDQERDACSSRSAAPCGRSRPAPRGRSGGSTTASPTAAKNQRSASAPVRLHQRQSAPGRCRRCLLILRPSLVDDQPQAHHVLVRRPAEDQRADRHQRVEPAAGLVDRLADELGRVTPARTPPRSAAARRTGRTASTPSRTRRR